jgi:hypothetical protein
VIKSRRKKQERHVACTGDRRGAYRVLVGKPDKNILLGTPRSRWENDIKINLKKVGWGQWNGLTWLRIKDRWLVLVNMVMNFQIPQTVRNFLTS